MKRNLCRSVPCREISIFFVGMSRWVGVPSVKSSNDGAEKMDVVFVHHGSCLL